MATYTLFGGSGGSTQASDTGDYRLAVEFYVTQSGCTLTQFWFYVLGASSGATDYGTALYTVDSGGATGTLVSGSSMSFPAMSIGWNAATLTTPIALTANQRYRAGVDFITDNGYTATAHYFDSGAGSSGITNGPLVAPNSTNAEGNMQGSFYAGTGAGFPSSTFNATNYWVDVTIDDNVRPSPIRRSPAMGALLQL